MLLDLHKVHIAIDDKFLYEKLETINLFLTLIL